MSHVSAEDLRVTKTRRLITDTLLALLAEKSFEEITVQEISARAMINRATFYRHYADKYDLIDRYVREVFDTFIAGLEPPPTDLRTVDLSRPPAVWITLFTHVAEHAVLYQVVLGKRSVPSFHSHIRSDVERITRERLHITALRHHSGTIPEDVLVQFATTALFGTLAWWLDNGIRYAPQEIAYWLMILLTHGCYGALESVNNTSKTR